MTSGRAAAAMTLVLVAALFGTIGTGLIYTALADHRWGAAAWGLPLALGGLYWCGRALSQGQRSLRRRRLSSSPSTSGALTHHTGGGPLSRALGGADQQ